MMLKERFIKDPTGVGLEPIATPSKNAEAQAFPDPTAEALAWLDEFETSVSVQDRPVRVDTSGKGRNKLVYLLDLDYPVSVSLGKCKLSTSGAFLKPVAYRLQKYDLVAARDHEHFISDEDLLPLRLFLALQSGNSYFFNDRVELSGEEGALLFRLALQSGRLFVKGDMDAPLALGTPQSLVLTWVRNDSDLQQLAFDVPVTQHVVPTRVPYYVEIGSHVVGELTTDLPPDLLRHLMNAPPLNDADAFVARCRLKQLADSRSMPIPLPDAGEAIPLGKPIARLVLGCDFFSGSPANPPEEHAIAELFFDYSGGLTLPGNPRPVAVVRHRVDGIWTAGTRDTNEECRIWDMMRSEGLEYFQQRMTGYSRVSVGEENCLIPGRTDAVGWLPFLSEGIKNLQSAGVSVVISNKFPYKLAQADDWFVELNEEPDSEWNSLNLGVLVEGHRISLISPLMRILKDRPKLFLEVRHLDDAGTFPVALDDHRVLAIPVPRLKAWLLPLLEFLDGGRPRVSRHHAAVLAGLEDHPATWIGGDELRRIGHKLRNFSGIEHCPPAKGFMTELRPYQQDGLNWLQFLRQYGLSGILADDMGLGKTVQTLAHIHCEKMSGRANLPCLVIATTSLMSNWRDEAAQFTPELNVLLLHGKERSDLFHQMDSADIVLTTYPLLVRDREIFLAKEFHLLVVDEAQFIKNPKAQAHQVARQIKARHRLSLTGTPLENHMGELWAQYDFLMPGFLGSSKRFSQVFRTPIEKQNDDTARDRLADRVRPFLLRRTKEQVLKDLPPRIEMTRWAELTAEQRDLYESLRVVFDKQLRQLLVTQGIGRSQIMILDALLKLRQVCCDPRLVKLSAAEAIAHRGTESAKLALLMEMLVELIDEGRKVLLFSQFTSMLTLIEEELTGHAIPYVKLTGQVHDRDTPIRQFQDGKVPLFLISLKAGGAGLNLTAADTVIHYDPWWNPAAEEQATARAHRIGQDKTVFVYKLLTLGTVEEKILELQDRKRSLADKLMHDRQRHLSSDSNFGNQISMEDLDVLFQSMI
jgi:superfamily II DNA or RNA helicase